ncbi:MAG: ribonuclease HI [Phycisphaerae bacterium]
MSQEEPHATDSKHPKPLVELYTDGDCIGNPGPGGWAFILRHPTSGQEKERSGGEHHTTNNRMEMLGVIRGLETLKYPCTVMLYSDSQYVVLGIMERMAVQAACRWHKSATSRTLIKNDDLWRQIYALAQKHSLTAHWIKGHAGHPENERCDTLASAAAKKISATPPGRPKTLEQMADDLLAEAEDSE